MKHNVTAVDTILESVRNMKYNDRVFYSTGDKMLDDAFMLSYARIDHMINWNKSNNPSVDTALRKIRREITEYQRMITATDSADKSVNVSVADEIVMGIYTFLLENSFSLDDLFHSYVSDKKLSKKSYGFNQNPRVKEVIIPAIKAMDNIVKKTVNNEKLAVDIGQSIYEQKSITIDGEEYGFLERKQNESVFSSDYGFIRSDGRKYFGEYKQLTFDCEMQEAFTVFSMKYRLTVGESKAISLYFLFGLSITACRKYMTDGDSKTSAKYVKKCLATALDKIVSGTDCMFPYSIYYKLIFDGIAEQMKNPIYGTVSHSVNVRVSDDNSIQALMKNAF